MYTAPA